MACASGSLELNPFLPLVAACLLESLDLLARADDILRRHCVEGLEADEARCRGACREFDGGGDGVVAAFSATSGPAKPPDARRRAPRHPGNGDFPRLAHGRRVRRANQSRRRCAGSARPAGTRNRSRMMPAPKGLRLHIALLRTPQRREIESAQRADAPAGFHCSPVAGTTTDPVEKPMELLPLGPVLFIDTAGHGRCRRTGRVAGAEDAPGVRPDRPGVLVAEAGQWGDFEEEMLRELGARKTPVDRGLQQDRPRRADRRPG